MKSLHRLEFDAGRAIHIKAPIYCHPSKPDHFEVRAYHLELLSIVQQYDRYWMPELDPLLFAEFRPLYQEVGDRLSPKIQVQLLESRSRHQFFISTGELTANPYDEAEQVPFPSYLEQLMGYRLPDKPIEGGKPPQVQLTSGDDDADLVAALQLTFKGSALRLMEQFSRVDLISMLSQAQNLLRGEDAIKELQQESDRELFDKNKEQIEAQFAKMGGRFF